MKKCYLCKLPFTNLIEVTKLYKGRTKHYNICASCNTRALMVLATPEGLDKYFILWRKTNAMVSSNFSQY